MKKLSLLLLPLVLPCLLSSCGNQDGYVRPAINNDVFDVDIPIRDIPIQEITLVNVPTTTIEIGYLSYMGMKMKVKYADGVDIDVPFTEKLLTKEHYSLLKTPGKKTIDFLFQGNHVSFDLSLKEAEVPVYHKISYCDHHNNIIMESSFPYLSKAVYNGPRVDSYYEGDYYYEFSGQWDEDLDNIYCDIIANAVYNKKDVRVEAHPEKRAYTMYDESIGDNVTKACYPLVADANPDGMLLNNYALYYLGQLDNVEVLTGATIYHEQGKFDKALGDVDEDSINLQNITRDIVRNGYRVGDRKTSSAYPYYEYLANIDDPLWLKVNPDRAYYGMPRGIAYKPNDAFLSHDYQRQDGRYVSFSSIINDDVVARIKDDLHPKNYHVYTSDPTGYYRVSYVMDIDLSLETMFEGMMNEYDYTMILNPQLTDLIPGYIGGSVRALLSYSPTGDFTERHSKPFRVDVEDLVSFLGMPD